ncbi:MAG: L,D-transpeptidase family protein [Chloroflexota bacterium]|nr:L,D-transpeptidase family protein [Chloroflexota bacterium]
MRHALLFTLIACFTSFGVMSCSGGSHAQVGVTIEPLYTATPHAVAAFAGKPDAPPISTSGSPASAGTSDTATAMPRDESTADAAAEPSPTPDLAPTSGRWIEVDVTRFVVRLMDGTSITREIAPVAVGTQIDTGEYASTQTGLFYVYDKIADLVYDPPYDTYISNWVAFDPDKANGFHSFLKDKSGNVVDASTGRISNGCIRTGGERAIFTFAEIGMPVWVHA